MEFTPEQITALLETLGLPADATDSELAVATAADLAAQVEGIDPAKPSTVAAAARKHGMDLIDHDTHEALKRDAAAGRQIAASAARAKVEAAVDDAVTKGRITPARRTHWVTLIEADPGMADVLAAVPNETAVPLREVGHCADKGAQDTETGQWFY
jgi:hypothetical protein